MRAWMLGTAVFAVGCFVGVEARADAAGGISGVAHVIDGDGISVGGIPDIRLQGIAAPEDNGAKRELGGPESTANLRALAEGKRVACSFDGSKTRGRPVAVCFMLNLQPSHKVADSEVDLGLHQVATGHARDCPRFSKGRFASAEAKARANGKNLSAIYALPGYCRP